MLYKNMKAIVGSPGGDTDFFNKVARVLQENTFATYLFILCLDYILRTSVDLIKENGFILKNNKEADNVPQKLWQMQTPETTKRFSQMHQPSRIFTTEPRASGRRH